MTDGITTPWQVRYVRWWWLREARRQRARGNLAGAALSALYARAIRPHWLNTGEIPAVTRTKAEALAFMSGAVPYPEAA